MIEQPLPGDTTYGTVDPNLALATAYAISNQVMLESAARDLQANVDYWGQSIVNDAYDAAATAKEIYDLFNQLVQQQRAASTPQVTTTTTGGGTTSTVSATPTITDLLQALLPPAPPPPPPIKTAPIDTVIFDDESIDSTIIADLILENVGGQEILSIARYDTINGQEVVYQPIKNLNLIQQQYNPNNIVKLQSTSDTIFANFAIKLDDKIPFVGNGTNGENVYLNDIGDLVIDLVNLLSDEQVEIEIIQDGTIYEVQI